MEEHLRVTRHYLPDYMLLLVITVHAKGQLKMSKLKTCRLKANRRDFLRVFKLVTSQNKFVKALAEDSKTQKFFATRELLSFTEILQLCVTLN